MAPFLKLCGVSMRNFLYVCFIMWEGIAVLFIFYFYRRRPIFFSSGAPLSLSCYCCLYSQLTSLSHDPVWFSMPYNLRNIFLRGSVSLELLVFYLMHIASARLLLSLVT